MAGRGSPGGAASAGADERLGTAPGAPVTGRRERNKARTRERIIEAATELFNRYGYEAVTVEQITDAADIALRTYYHYFDSKAAVALARFQQWADDMGAALAAQPGGLTPPEVLAGAFATMADRGYAGGEQLRTAEGRPLLPAPAAVLLSESDPEVAGLVYQRLVEAFHRLAAAFGGRLGYAEGAVEGQAIAGTLVALWFVVVHGQPDGPGSPGPSSVNERGLAAFDLYSKGLGRLWEPMADDPAG